MLPKDWNTSKLIVFYRLTIIDINISFFHLQKTEGEMMNKIQLNICNNPACYREAAQLFKELNAILCPALKERVVITGNPCDCTQGKALCATAPCVEVDGRLIRNAHAGDVKEAVEKALRHQRAFATAA
jgi:NADH:ubiquinone oxidoreductase subunit E